MQANVRAARARGTPPLGSALVVVLVLWLLTVLAADVSWSGATVFWLAVGALLVLWIGVERRRASGRAAGRFESALRRNEADVYDVKAERFAELEEAEDEGACYAFELDGGRLLFVAGQTFYAGPKFPSLDFALVHVLDEDGRVVDELVEKRAERSRPSRTISAAAKADLDAPRHLEVRSGTIAELERVLGGRETAS